MQRPTYLAIPLVLVACKAISEPETPEQQSDRAARVEASAPLTAKPFRISPPSSDIEPVSPEHAAVLEMMREPEFAQRFSESWLSETDVEPRVGQLEREAYQEVVLAISEDDLPRAFELLSVQLGPEGNALFDYVEGNLRYTAEDFDLAAEAYERAVVKHPKYRRAWLNLGQTHARLANFEGAVEAFGHVVSLGGADATVYALMGIALSNQQDYLASESAFRMAVLLDPSDRQWRMGLTESLFKQERFADAVAMCESLLREDPERSEVWMLQANAYARMGQTRKAAENLEVLHGLGKGTVETFNLLGDIYVNEQLYELARENYTQALRAAPDTGGPRAVRAAQDLAARGALEESSEMIARVEALATAGIDGEQRMAILKLRARIAMASGASDEQVRILEEIVRLDPLDGEALLLLGQHFFREADYDRATLYFDRAMGMEKHEAEAARGKAQVLARQGRYADALPLLRRAQTLDPRESVQDFLEQIERIVSSR